MEAQLEKMFRKQFPVDEGDDDDQNNQVESDKMLARVLKASLGSTKEEK